MKRPSATAAAAAAAAVSFSVTAANKRGRTAGIAAVKASTQRGTAVINNGAGTMPVDAPAPHGGTRYSLLTDPTDAASVFWVDPHDGVRGTDGAYAFSDVPADAPAGGEDDGVSDLAPGGVTSFTILLTTAHLYLAIPVVLQPAIMALEKRFVTVEQERVVAISCGKTVYARKHQVVQTACRVVLVLVAVPGLGLGALLLPALVAMPVVGDRAVAPGLLIAAPREEKFRTLYSK